MSGQENLLPNDYPVMPDNPSTKEMFLTHIEGHYVLWDKADKSKVKLVLINNLESFLKGNNGNEVIVHKGFDLWTANGAKFVKPNATEQEALDWLEK